MVCVLVVETSPKSHGGIMATNIRFGFGFLSARMIAVAETPYYESLCLATSKREPFLCQVGTCSSALTFVLGSQKNLKQDSKDLRKLN
jgi:hypothetical protein